MNTQKELILINGEDQTDSVAYYEFVDSKCRVVFRSSSKAYFYTRSKVQVFPLKERLNPEKVILSVDGHTLSQVHEILDYGAYYRIFADYDGGLYRRDQVTVEQNCIAEGSCADRFAYFRRIGTELSLKTPEGYNILEHQYQRIQSVSERTALSSFLKAEQKGKNLMPPAVLLYPFGLNQSQKKAVENAFAAQISIIQGPPGTGKTQTILNILANAVYNGKTVAVVSNNNSATHNVVEKLQKKNLDFLTAFLGSRANKAAFLEAQTGSYPDMQGWKMEREAAAESSEKVRTLTEEINQRLNDKNRIAEIEQELLVLDPESRYFEEYYQSCRKLQKPEDLKLSSRKALELLNEYEAAMEKGEKPGFFTKLRILIRYHWKAVHLFLQEPEAVMPYLQKQFYQLRTAELHQEKAQLEENLRSFYFDAKAKELTEASMRLFRDALANRYRGSGSRKLFENTDLSRRSEKFTKEYPVVLSTTYSIKSSLDTGFVYDYLIVDEASQVDLATGVLALSCAKNVVIVGDLKQLPNVLTDQDIEKADQFWENRIGEPYRFTTHSLLSAATEVWKEASSVLLREHYRCHPKIINFCNEAFYDGKLIVMTSDHGETDALSLYRTSQGSHARGHLNHREADVIQNEVLPRLHEKGYTDIAVIAPYCDQVELLRKELPGNLEVDTVHKYQGREKDAIVLTSVDNVITDFVDDPHMLNVAVSRAVKSLTVVTSSNPKNDRTRYGDLARYIAYHNFEVIDSSTYSVFDLLYKENAALRREFLQKNKRISEFDSENLMNTVLEEVLQETEFRQLSCTAHVSLCTVIRERAMLSEEEKRYLENPLTHTDFLVFRKMDKTPVLAIEVDGVSFHGEGTKQAERDRKKDHILQICGLPLLRLRTDTSREKEKVETALRNIMNG